MCVFTIAVRLCACLCVLLCVCVSCVALHLVCVSECVSGCVRVFLPVFACVVCPECAAWRTAWCMTGSLLLVARRVRVAASTQVDELDLGLGAGEHAFLVHFNDPQNSGE